MAIDIEGMRLRTRIGKKALLSAREEAQAALQCERHSVAGHLGMAAVSAALGQPLDEADHLQRCLTIDPDCHPARFELALNYFRRGMNAESIEELMHLSARQAQYPGLNEQLAAVTVMSEVARRNPLSGSYAPVFLLAPVARCGSTFLQRLISSSGKVVIFGENLDLTKRLPESVEAASFRMARHDKPSIDGGNEYFAAMAQGFYELVEFYQQVANKAGRIWGLKDPYSGQMGTLRNLLPAAKFIFLYRDLFDVARSYKARGWFGSPFDVAKLARDWQEEIRKALLAGDRQILLLPYEQLIAEPAVWIEKIERFLGIAGIQRETLAIKVNNPGEEYLPPAKLSDEEIALLRGNAEVMLSRLGYL